MALAVAAIVATGRALYAGGVPNVPPPRRRARRRPADSGPAVTDVYTASGVVPVESLASQSLAGTRVDVVSQLPADIGLAPGRVRRRDGHRCRPGDRRRRRSRGARQGGRPAGRGDRLPAGPGDRAGAGRAARGPVRHRGRARAPLDRRGLPGQSRHRREGRCLARRRRQPVRRRVRDRGGEPHLVPEGRIRTSGLRGAPDMGRADHPDRQDRRRRPDALVPGGPAGHRLRRRHRRLRRGPRAPRGRARRLRHTGPRATATFLAQLVRTAFDRFGRLAFGDGNVLGGVASALHTPPDIAALPMFVDPPMCWLHLAGGTDRLSWPRGGSAALAAFPFPAADPAYSDVVRGRTFMVVVFHDRPEVRRLVDSLLGDGLAARRSDVPGPGRDLADRFPPDSPSARTRSPDRKATCCGAPCTTGTFRVSASDLMPAPVAAAFSDGVGTYLAYGPPMLDNDARVTSRRAGRDEVGVRRRARPRHLAGS